MPVLTRPLTLADAAACDAVVRGLPEWFGHEGGRAECARAVREQRGVVAEDSGAVVGFATWARRTEAAAEITWAAVRRDRRHGGAGTAIVERIAAEIAADGYALALVMTSASTKAATNGADPYEETRRFWRSRGFLPLIELDIWETNMALLLVRPLGGAAV